MDKAGKMNYGDLPPADATDVERIKISSESTPNDDLPYATRRAQENFPVTLYACGGCGEACTQGRDLLSKRGIPYSEKLLQTREDIDAFKQLSGIDSVVPVLQVGKDFLKGYLESQWNTELDVAGYPKTASYRQRFAPPVQAGAIHACSSCSNTPLKVCLLMLPGSTSPAGRTMKLATWNVNSLKVRLPHVLDWLAANPVDVLCLQETKQQDSDFPQAELQAAGYHSVFSGQKTYNGVAILSRAPAGDVQMRHPRL